MNEKYKPGDRFFSTFDATYCTLINTHANSAGYTNAWSIEWSNGAGPDLIFIHELDNLKIFNVELIKIKDDKHLFELQLKY